jgi:hypothetical protein
MIRVSSSDNGIVSYSSEEEKVVKRIKVIIKSQGTVY